ncbi:uncharacterized protein PFL1_02996 [Pseudozyma flocculosa PF-1]|uniref:Related to Histidine triad protein n=2 Tax=Pseudozyma flocculosa TaxID=84751 RepID=A0A5C3F0Z1_9BASI|nr:uncharacterized protein PFL1_02996 [Pseudozyma flocculosa PF-1]EPQ29241.1 hypothetical protein PFL1_02996 [Pseudozyma flocculosa PF-1]SPO37740.1 related to Histidine triad protein [Pseudozyma flocculosa]
MTTHTLAQFNASKSLPSAPLSSMDESCAFCRIVSRSLPAHVVYEDESTLAFLDILPLRRGHTLVIPKAHVPTLSQLSPHQAATLAQSLVCVSAAVGRAMGDDRLQVITNQIYAQIVPHVHFHIVPAPPLPSSSSAQGKATATKSTNPMSLMGLGHGREELDDDDAEHLVKLIRHHIDHPPSSDDASDGKAKL